MFLANRSQCQVNIIFLSVVNNQAKSRCRCASRCTCVYVKVCVCVVGICNNVCMARFRLKIMLCLPTVSTKSSSDSATKQNTTFFWSTMTTNQTKVAKQLFRSGCVGVGCECMCVSYLATKICVNG